MDKTCTWRLDTAQSYLTKEEYIFSRYFSKEESFLQAIKDALEAGHVVRYAERSGA